MKSLETLLAESLGLMTESQKSKFYDKRVKGMPIEGQVHLAKECLEDVRESRRISRNNGGTRQVTEQDRREGVMAECDRVLFSGMEACRSTAKGISDLVESNGQYVRKTEGQEQLTESQRQDYEFSRLIGLSESEALTVAKSNCIRRN